MSDREALLAAVVADPDNDLPRLVYADWLEEHGDPKRAEFIRLQIEHVRLHAADSHRRTALMLRAAELYANERLRWIGELPTPKGAKWVDQDGKDLGYPAFDCGFASNVRISSDKVLSSMAAQLFAVTPVRMLVVQRVRFAKSLLGLTPPPSLRRLQVTELTQSVADALTACPLLDQLTEVSLPLSALPTQSRQRLRRLFGKRLRTLTLYD